MGRLGASLVNGTATDRQVDAHLPMTVPALGLAIPALRRVPVCALPGSYTPHCIVPTSLDPTFWWGTRLADSVRTFADLYMDKVAGLVMDDADADDVEPKVMQEDQHRREGEILSRLRDCRDAIAEHKPLPALPPRPGQLQRTCAQQFFRGLPEAPWSAELNAKLMEIAQTKVAMYDAYLSEME
jgi:hypothetical protein